MTVSGGEEHDLFTSWAVGQGIIVNGVGPMRFGDRGIGMVALQEIKENEAIVRVPLQAMVTVETVPPSFTSKFPDETSTHALLAAFLCHGESEDLERYELWRRTWPTRKDFEDSMPILWGEPLRGSSSPGLLPPSISGRWRCIQKPKLVIEYESSHQNILVQQEKRLHDAWHTVSAVFPDANWELFSYHWLIVNTRSFFYLTPGEKAPDDRNDAMAMLPFADYFNHSDEACNVNFDGREYIFRAARAYEPGEEIFMSYGPHPNDFLFTEYGFYLEANESEALYLDDIIFQDLSPSLQEELNLQQYFGCYQIAATGTCYRTEIAACIKYMPLEDWRNYALGYSTRGADAAKSEDVIRGWIRTYLKEAGLALIELRNTSSSTIAREYQEKVQLLLRRWMQVEHLCRSALEAVSC
ncbi:hypothetical protein BJY04DRAFT_205616 [Aspergillus karnatakaensis]|uniref:uncharacterized protein n=1 Tax=Aspergillus karnatakaensis TaxID=1810916 RepID=UPI003CCCF3E5